MNNAGSIWRERDLRDTTNTDLSIGTSVDQSCQFIGAQCLCAFHSQGAPIEPWNFSGCLPGDLEQPPSHSDIVLSLLIAEENDLREGWVVLIPISKSDQVREKGVDAQGTLRLYLTI